MKTSRLFGLIVLAVQLIGLAVFGLSMHTMYEVVTSAASEEAFGLEMVIDEAAGTGVVTVNLAPRNGGYLGADMTVELGAIDEAGAYLAKNSTRVYLEPGARRPLSLRLVIPLEEIGELLEGSIEGLLEVTVDVRTLKSLVGFSSTMRFGGGGAE